MLENKRENRKYKIGKERGVRKEKGERRKEKGEDRKHLYGELWRHYFYYFFGIIFRLSPSI